MSFKAISYSMKYIRPYIHRKLHQKSALMNKAKSSAVFGDVEELMF